MPTFFWLLFVHFLADLPLQGEWVAKNKGKEPLFLLGHVCIWTGFIILGLHFLGIDIPAWKFYFLFIGHYIADFLKCFYTNKLPLNEEGELMYIAKKKARLYVYTDQIFHLFQLLIVYGL